MVADEHVVAHLKYVAVPRVGPHSFVDDLQVVALVLVVDDARSGLVRRGTAVNVAVLVRDVLKVGGFLIMNRRKL